MARQRRSFTLSFGVACLAAWMPAWQQAAACNPAPPRPPILQGYAYDATAAGALLRDADSVVAARLSLRLDLDLERDEGKVDRADYVFEVLEGWKAPVAHRLTIGGYWLDCAIEPRRGRVFLLYLEGERLLHAVPVAELDFELALLGEPDWFFDARGRRVHAAED
jgi:hypothetical protein